MLTGAPGSFCPHPGTRASKLQHIYQTRLTACVPGKAPALLASGASATARRKRGRKTAIPKAHRRRTEFALS